MTEFIKSRVYCKPVFFGYLDKPLLSGMGDKINDMNFIIMNHITREGK